MLPGGRLAQPIRLHASTKVALRVLRDPRRARGHRFGADCRCDRDAVGAVSLTGGMGLLVFDPIEVGRHVLSRACKRLAVDFAFLMCGLREDRNNVYSAKQIDPCRSGAAIGTGLADGLAGSRIRGCQLSRSMRLFERRSSRALAACRSAAAKGSITPRRCRAEHAEVGGPDARTHPLSQFSHHRN